MAALAPQRATLTLTSDSTPVLGLMDISITDKTAMEDITCDADSAVQRFPTINDGDIKITCITDPADTGQMAMLADKAAHTSSAYVATKGTTPKTFTFTAFVSDIAYSRGPKDVQKTDFTLAVSGGIAVS